MHRWAIPVLCLGLAAAPATFAQQPENIVLKEGVTKLSPHVYALYGNPNIGIVVGSAATLVIDTGLGKPNGALIAAEAAKLHKGGKLLLTTTHFHPEHAAGRDGFPADAVVIRPKVQQQEYDESGERFIEIFRSRNDTNRNLLAGAHVDKADILFDTELTVDLGDATVRLMWFGPAHTNGDMVAFVEPDRLLVTGDIAQNKFIPLPIGSQSSFKSWLAVLDKLEALKPAIILPDHSPPGDAAMIPEQRAFMIDLMEHARTLKKEGKSAEDATKTLVADFGARYAGWARPGNLDRAAAAAYNEAK